MALRNVLTEENKTLYKTSRPVVKFDERLHTLLDDMTETLVHANGVGLAAPQVGVLRRAVIVLETNVPEGEESRILLNCSIRRSSPPKGSSSARRAASAFRTSTAL